jgi:hypothetical protein
MVVETLDGALFDEATHEPFRSSLPEPAFRFFELVTHFGDGATLLAVVALVYWFGSPARQRTRALVVAIALVALAVSAGLKGSVGAARPDVAFAHATDSPYSFPSGHALGSAAVYGAVAVYGRVGTRPLRYAVAGTIVALVALSRVVIGAHFLGASSPASPSASESPPPSFDSIPIPNRYSCSPARSQSPRSRSARRTTRR